MSKNKFTKLALVVFTYFMIFPELALSSGSLNIEMGQTKTSYNYFQLPNDDSNLVNLPDDKYLNSYRVNGRINLKNDSFISFLYAPLNADYDFTSNNSFNFNNTLYASETSTRVSYKFNSYRIGYFKKFENTSRFKYWFGGVLKVRDAKIEVRQGNISNSYSNVGLVPLLGAGGEYFFVDHISLFSHIETLGFTQGYAYDFNSELRYYFKNNNIGFGYRTTGGGVDNDKLMNFARFETFYMNYGMAF